ncbi:NAD(P)-dependent oxidoreductase [Pigmentiphaga soli]|uniref:NAD(P)-dependent oxidoreductase n=1 Tax=Pigmentiphaga soli TaxID=1007095 RepID=A0ABP8HAM1_9BURK
MTTKHHIGFLGLGQMGGLIAANLLRDDATLHIFDPSPAAREPFVKAGAVAHGSPREVADAADIVFACLPSPAVSKEVAFGANGVAGAGRARVYVELSTIGREAVQAIAARLNEAGIAVLDAPVSGASKSARAGTLSIMAAGPRQALETARPFFERIGKRIFAIDERPGLGQVMKLVNNLISATAMASSYEALVMGAKAGLDPDLMVEVINASTGRNSATLEKVPDAILPGTFDFGSALRIIAKDVDLGLAEAHSLGATMWVAETVGQLWRFAISQGAAEDDYTTLIRFMEKWAGVEVRSRKAQES